MSRFLLIVLLCLLPIMALSQITLPIEVVGASGTSATVSVTLPSTIVPTTPYTLQLQVHDLSYVGKAGVSLNGGDVVPLNNATCTVQGTAAKYGGIGGGFSTLVVTMPILPVGTLVAGVNTLSFTFLATDGVSSGFRVLAFNILGPQGNQLLPASSFVQEDPSTWTPPLNNPADIAAGKVLYQTAALLLYPSGPSTKAHCGDCHTQDGRDLKYYCYSNASILARSMFHGLSANQGNQIASYIRSLNVPAVGRPWNPPYQPGPGIDSLPVTSWSAGAGLSNILDSDLAMEPFLPPASLGTTASLNTRQIPIALQFPDWNHWLPRVWPGDVFGADFSNSLALYLYNGTGGYPASASQWNLQSVLNTGNVNATLHPGATPTSANIPALFAGKYVQVLVNEFGAWNNARYTLSTAEIAKSGFGGSSTSSALSQGIYSLALWQLVKTWEFMQEYGLEGYGPQIFGATYGEPRTWFSGIAFQTSPFFLHIPDGPNGIGGGIPSSAITNEYFSNIWYQVQLTLDDTNHAGAGTSPIDWGYLPGKLKDMLIAGGAPEPLRLVEYIARGMQVTDNGTPPNAINSGWSPFQDANVCWLVHPNMLPMFATLPAASVTQILQTMLQSWFTKTSQYTPAQYYAIGLASSAEVPVSWYDGDFAGKVLYSLPQFAAKGVSPVLLNQVSAWFKTLCPLGAWPTYAATTPAAQ